MPKMRPSIIRVRALGESGGPTSSGPAVAPIILVWDDGSPQAVTAAATLGRPPGLAPATFCSLAGADFQADARPVATASW